METDYPIRLSNDQPFRTSEKKVIILLVARDQTINVLCSSIRVGLMTIVASSGKSGRPDLH
jgi:hypothetical protein